MAGTPGITSAELTLAAKLVDEAMCGDYCFDTNCKKCLEARVSALFEVARNRIRRRGKIVRAQVDDGLLHGDALKVLRELYGDMLEVEE